MKVRSLEMKEGEKSRRADKKGGRLNKKRDIKHFRDLEVYRRAFKAAMTIYQSTKAFPPAERYSLVDQIRKASRSVCSTLAEAWRKRRYIAVFKNKVTDSI